MSYCPYCGTEQVNDAVFCQSCGKKLPDKENSGTEVRQPEVKKRNKKPMIVGAAVLALAVILGAVFFFLGSKPFSQDPKAIERSAESVVMLNCYGLDGELISTGSGIVLYDDSTIVTNYHVIDLAKEVKISTEQDHTVDIACVLGYDIDKDICILKTKEATGLSPLPLGSSAEMKKGEPVTAIGSPLGLKNVVSTGVLSGRAYNDVAQFDELQFSASISSGSSGGALFNDKGEVIGITSASFVDGQNMNLAIPAEEIEKISRDGSMTVEELLYSSYENIKAIYDAQPVDFPLLYEDTQEYNGKVISTQATVAFVEDQGDTLLIGVTDEYEWLLSMENTDYTVYIYSGGEVSSNSISDFCKERGFSYTKTAILTIDKNNLWYMGEILPGDVVEVCGIFSCDYVGDNVKTMVYDDVDKYETIYWSMWDTYNTLATIDGYCLMKVE